MSNNIQVTTQRSRKEIDTKKLERLLEEKNKLEKFLKKLKTQENKLISGAKLTRMEYNQIYKQTVKKLERIKESISLFEKDMKNLTNHQ